MGQRGGEKWTGIHNGDKSGLAIRPAGKLDPKIATKLERRNVALSATKSGKYGDRKAKSVHLAGSVKKGGGW